MIVGLSVSTVNHNCKKKKKSNQLHHGRMLTAWWHQENWLKSRMHFFLYILLFSKFLPLLFLQVFIMQFKQNPNGSFHNWDCFWFPEFGYRIEFNAYEFSCNYKPFSFANMLFILDFSPSLHFSLSFCLFFLSQTMRPLNREKTNRLQMEESNHSFEYNYSRQCH